MPIEPDVGFADMGENGTFTIHSKSIAVFLHHAMIAPGIGIDPERLTLIQNPAGGTFGYKFSPTMEALLGVAALATGKPVFLNYDWYQQQTYTGKRSPFLCTNHAWGSAVRGYGSSQSEFASEVLMEMLAEKLKMDPFDLRLKNVYRKGSATPTGQVPDSYSLPEMFEKLKPKYEAAKAKVKQLTCDTEKYGVGLSVGVYGCGLDGPDGSEAKVCLNVDGSVTLFNSWEDHGQGADQTLASQAGQGAGWAIV